MLHLPFALLIVFLLLDPVLLNPIHYGLLALCLGIAGLILYLLNAPIRHEVLVVGAITTVVSLCCAWFSGYFWNGFEYTLVIGAATIAGSTGPRLNVGAGRRVLVVGLTLLGGWVLLELALEYYQQVQLFGWFGIVRLPVLGFRNPNVFARFMGLIGLGLFLVPTRDRYRVLSVPFLLLLLLSGSRGALLALGLAVLTYFFSKTNTRVSLREPVIVLCLGLLVAVIGLSVYPTAMAKVTALQRVNLVQESFQLLAENPITGVAPWNFGLVYPEFSLDDQWQRHPHSLPLWLLTAFGYAGGVLVLGTGIVLLRGSFRVGFLPLVVFLAAHELVDTMFWIPGVFLLSVILLTVSVSARNDRARGSWLLPVLGLFVVTSGLFVSKTDLNFKQGLKDYRVGEIESALNHWGNDWTGFTAAHRGAAFAKQGKLKKADQALRDAIRANAYDPYYVVTKARLQRRLGRSQESKRYLARYGEMDPYRMLTLEEREARNVNGDSGLAPRPVSFVELWWNQRNPRFYLFLVEEALESGHLNLARRRIEFLLGLPKLTREARDVLVRYRSQVTKSQSDTANQSGGSMSQDGTEKKMFRNQFHYFLYRRPGSDYVPHRPND